MNSKESLKNWKAKFYSTEWFLKKMKSFTPMKRQSDLKIRQFFDLFFYFIQYYFFLRNCQFKQYSFLIWRFTYQSAASNRSRSDACFHSDMFYPGSLCPFGISLVLKHWDFLFQTCFFNKVCFQSFGQLSFSLVSKWFWESITSHFFILSSLTFCLDTCFL